MTSSESLAFEPILVVLEFWDRPRSGIAEFRGVPHFFECEFDTVADEFSDIHTLRPVDQETISLAYEKDRITKAWWAAHRRGEVPFSSKPDLPGQNARHAELETTIKARISRLSPPIARAHGTFRIEPNHPQEIAWKVVP